MEIDLEIEAPGAAEKVAEEGASTYKESDYIKLQDQLKKARADPANKLGKGGFLISLLDPIKFENTMKVVTKLDPDNTKVDAKSYNMQDKA
jgi:hypothetical protein